MMGNPNFSDAFKRNAVVQITERGYSVSEVAQQRGVNLRSLYAWKWPLAKAVSGNDDKEAESRQFKRELARVRRQQAVERTSVVITTDLSLSERASILGKAKITAAPPDRFPHHGHILETGNDRFRASFAAPKARVGSTQLLTRPARRRMQMALAGIGQKACLGMAQAFFGAMPVIFACVGHPFPAG